MSLVEPPPEACPGTGTEESGKAAACAGCPNQAICASAGPAAPDPDVDLIARNLDAVKNIVLVLSGKGGVGKSTVTATLARCFATKEDLTVGVLDINLCVMSAGFLLPSPDAAVIWRGPKKNGLIKQLLRDVDWGGLDLLLVDTPPGTTDEHLSIVQYLA